MKTFLAAAIALTGACVGQPPIEPINNPAARIDGATSGLAVPSSCPIYVPGDYDQDTPELPYVSPLLFGCGVDSTGATYGTVTGDGGTHALGVLQGGREIGMYYAFDATVADEPPTLALLGLGGPNPLITAWSAPDKVDGPGPCCAEGNGVAVPVEVVALGAGGMLLSLGTFDTTPTQVEIGWSPAAMFPDHHFKFVSGWNDRFYVNAPAE